MPVKAAIVVHGGAGSHNMIQANVKFKSGKEDGIKGSALAGWTVLQAGGSALDAVQAAVAYMEDDEYFNAGKGSCLTRSGNIQMDACIMDGETLKAGGVTCIENVANPIKVARAVMQKGEAVLLCGDQAKKFALEQGFQEVPFDYLATETMINRLRDYKSAPRTFHLEQKPETDKGHDTVGAVAVDAQGHVAYANSTGGMVGKPDGRIGDSPLIGAGGYACDEVGATATTGKGEGFMKTVLGYHAIMLMKQGQSLEEALENSMQFVASPRVGGYGGIIGVTNQGQVAVNFGTQAMSWAWIQDGDTNLHWGLYQKEHFLDPL